LAGQIIDRGNNKYLVRVYLGTDSMGKRQYSSKIITGKKEANTYLSEMLHKKNVGMLSHTGKTTVEEYLNNWFEVVKNRVSEKTFLGYQDLIKRYVLPSIGKKRLDKLKPEHIQSIINGMTDKGLSPRTVRYTHMIFKNSLEHALKWELIFRNPAQHIELPKQKRSNTLVLDEKQSALLLKEAKYTPFKALFSLMLTSGMRPSEALALKWSDVDFQQNRVQVAKTLLHAEKGGGWSLEETKTDRSRRTIPLPLSTMADLKEHKNDQLEQILEAKPKSYNNHGFVFAARNGEPMDRRNIIKRYFKPMLKRAGLPDIRLYDLRHTCATLLLRAGENPKIVSERLGHASIVLTLDTYSHVLPDMQQSCADKLEDILFKETNKK